MSSDAASYSFRRSAGPVSSSEGGTDQCRTNLSSTDRTPPQQHKPHALKAPTVLVYYRLYYIIKRLLARVWKIKTTATAWNNNRTDHWLIVNINWRHAWTRDDASWREKWFLSKLLHSEERLWRCFPVDNGHELREYTQSQMIWNVSERRKQKHKFMILHMTVKDSELPSGLHYPTTSQEYGKTSSFVAHSAKSGSDLEQFPVSSSLPLPEAPDPWKPDSISFRHELRQETPYKYESLPSTLRPDLNLLTVTLLFTEALHEHP